MPAAVQADPDDDDLRHAGWRAADPRTRHRVADPRAAWLHRRRWPRRLTSTHPVHHADHLHLHRSALAIPGPWEGTEACAGAFAWSGDMIRNVPMAWHWALLPAIAL